MAKLNLKGLNKSKVNPKAAEVEAEEEEVVETTPAKKTVGKPGSKLSLGKKPAKVEEPEEEEEEVVEEEQEEEEVEEETSDEVEEEEEEEPVPAKKTVGKKPAGKVALKKPAKVEEPEEEEEEQEEEQEEEEEEEVEEAPKKTLGKKPVGKTAPAKAPSKTLGKKPAKVEEDEAEEEEETEGKSSGARSLFNTPRQTRTRVAPVEGATITRDDVLRMFAEQHGYTIADTKKALENFENFFRDEIFPKFSVNLFGVKFKRIVTQPRIYQGAGGLDVSTSPLATLVHEHVQVKAAIALGKTSTKGMIDDDGEFVEGNIDEDGGFVAGTWTTDEEGVQSFEPAEAPAKKAPAKKKK